MTSDDAPDVLAQDLVASGRGDRTAFRRVHAVTAGRLLAICMSVTRERPAAEDVLQEVFVKIWAKAATYDPERARPMSWLGTIARNSAIDWRRSRKMMFEPNSGDVENVASETELVEHRMIRQETETRALQMVAELDRDTECDVRRIYLEGMTYAETAERDGVPIGTLKSRVRRALIRLRTTLNDD